jgi:hypothetical protein
METYNFKVKHGDTFTGVQFELIRNGTAIDLTGAEIRCSFVKGTIVTEQFEMSTANGKIVITDAVEGKFKIASQIITATPGYYNYDVQITFENTDVKTYIQGTLTVEPDITQ